MKLKALLFYCCFFTLHLSAQDTLSSYHWQEDLRFLTETVHDEYDFLFKKVEKSQFDSAVQKLFAEIPHLESHEVIVGLARIVALFQYGHTSINLNAWRPREAFQFHQR